MKISQEESVFQPITLTLESEHEARVLKTLLGSVTGDNKFRDVTSQAFSLLSRKGIDIYHCKEVFNSDNIDLDS